MADTPFGTYDDDWVTPSSRQLGPFEHGNVVSILEKLKDLGLPDEALVPIWEWLYDDAT